MLESLINQDFWVTLAGAAAVLLQFVLTASVILRVILTRHPPGSSFAWILLVTILPYIGFILYVWLGERPIGRWRALRLRHLLKHWEEVTDEGYAISGTLPTMPHGQRHKGLTRLAERLGDLPMSCGSRLELISDSIEALSRIEYDVNNARKSVSMEFYIWGVGGWCDRVAQAIIRAAERGCECRILVDDIGARAWLRSSWPSKMLAAGVHVSRALPVSLFPITKGRADLRLHRKRSSSMITSATREASISLIPTSSTQPKVSANGSMRWCASKALRCATSIRSFSLTGHCSLTLKASVSHWRKLLPFPLWVQPA